MAVCRSCVGFVTLFAFASSVEMHANIIFDSIKVDFHMHLKQGGYRTFDLIPLGYRYNHPSISVFFPPYTMDTTTRQSNCDGMVNGVPVNPMRSMLEFTDGTHDGCELTLPLSNEPKVTKVTIIVISRYFMLEVQNETRFEYEFDIANMPEGKEVLFDWTSSYQVTPIRQPDGRMRFDVAFSMNGQITSPEFVLVDFQGVNLNSSSPDAADISFCVDGNKTDPRVSVITEKTDKSLTGSVTLDSSLSQETSGIRGLLYISGTFKIGPYLVMKAGINAGRMIYKLYDKYYLFPYGKFGMLEPKTTTIFIEPNKLNIIPCHTIGASQYGFQYTPFLLKKSSKTNDTWIHPKFDNHRLILDLYVRESSGIIYNPSENVDGLYTCVLEYDKVIGSSRVTDSQAIRRMFNVVTKG